jgi:hypothetical protein
MKTVAVANILLVLVALQTVGIAQASDPAPGVSGASPESARLEGKYEGAWVSTGGSNLDGIANCEVKQLSKDRWQGRFWGGSKQKPFDYTVDFSLDKRDDHSSVAGEQSKVKRGAVLVKGKATIDGAHYDLAGELNAGEFKIHVTGGQSEGSMLLKRVPQPKSVAKNGK